MNDVKRPIHILFETLPEIGYKKFEENTEEIKKILLKYEKYFKEYDYYEQIYENDRSFDFSNCYNAKVSETESDLDEYLTKFQNSSDIKVFAELVIHILEFLLRNSDSKYNELNPKFKIDNAASNLNFYTNPELIFAHKFIEMKEDNSKVHANYSIICDINIFYEKCLKMLSNFVIPTNHEQLHNKDGKLDVNFFDSLDLFLALNLTKWLMVYDPEQALSYYKNLRVFFAEFLTNYEYTKDINPYLKAKFGFILKNEMRATYISYPISTDPQLEEILKKKQTEQIQALIKFLQELAQITQKIDILMMFSSLENQYLDKEGNFVNSDDEFSFISLLSDKEERVRNYAAYILKNTKSLSEDSYNKLQDYLNTSDVTLRQQVLDILEGKNFKLVNEEEEITYLISQGKHEELSKFLDNDFVHSSLVTEFEGSTEDVQVRIIESLVVVKHKNNVEFLTKIANMPLPVLKRKAIDILAEIGSDEAIVVLHDIFQNGTKHETSEFGPINSENIRRKHDSQIFAILALAKIKDKGAIRKFVEMLNEPEKLTTFDTYQKEKLLTDFYESDRLHDKGPHTSDHFNAVLMSLLSLQDSEITEKVINFMDNTKRNSHRGEILKNLPGLIYDEKLTDLIKEYFPSDDSLQYECAQVLVQLENESAINYAIDLLENPDYMFKFILSNVDKIVKEDEGKDYYKNLDEEAYKNLVKWIIELLEKDSNLMGKLSEKHSSCLQLFENRSKFTKPVSFYQIDNNEIKQLIEKTVYENSEESLSSIILLGMIKSYNDYIYPERERPEPKIHLLDKPIINDLVYRVYSYQNIRKIILSKLRGNIMENLPEPYIEALLRLTNDYNLGVRKRAILLLGRVQNKKYYPVIIKRLLELMLEKEYYLHLAAHDAFIPFFVPGLDPYGDTPNKEQMQKVFAKVDNQDIIIERLYDCEDKTKFKELIEKLLDWKIKNENSLQPKE